MEKTTRKWKKLLSRDANILSKYLVIQGIQKGPNYVLPGWGGIKNQLWTWGESETGIHFLFSELQKYTDYVVSYALKHPGFPSIYRQKSIKICDNVVRQAVLLSKKTNSKITNKQLNALFENYCKNFIQLGQTILMTLEEIQDQVVSKIGDPKKVGILTTPTELSVEAREELDRLLLVDLIKNKYKNLLQGNGTKNNLDFKKYPTLYNKISAHAEKYGWLPLNYEKDIWDTHFFIELLKNYIKNPYAYGKRIEELKNFSAQRSKEKQSLFKKLDAETKTLANLIEATGFIRLYRANTFSLAYFKALPLFKEVALRVDLPLRVLNFFTPKEVTAALLSNKKLQLKKGKARVNSFAMLTLDSKYKQFEGNEALSLMHKEVPTEKIAETKEVKGMCAYPGKIKGKVSLVFDAREMHKVKEGNILICKETNPDLIIVMGKAGAIVTDEGGLTSHAAIVSREMKKPCVIGTKIATKVFKDGDMVEVDANKGIVRKI